MDKYELNIKVEKIKKHAEKKDYAAAVKIADTIDWSKVKNIRMLTLVSQVYEKTKNYTEAKNVLLFAYERVPMGRRMLYKLTELCVKEGNIEEAENFFEEFQKVSPNDNNKLLLTYQIESAKNGSLNYLISILEQYRKSEFVEKWAYELAILYHKAGRVEECVQLCNDIILWFSVGTYVDRALNLKMQYEPLTPSEQEKLVNKKKYEDRVRAVEREFEKRGYRGFRDDDGEVIERRRKREQMQEAAMTSEPKLKIVSFPKEDPEETDVAAKEEVADTNIIEETSAALERMLFEEEKSPEQESGAETLSEEIIDMQVNLAQAVQEAAKESEDPEKAAAEEELLGQTKEVVKETREALGQETRTDFEETDEFLNEMSASLAKAIFSEEASGEPEEVPAAGEEVSEKPEEGFAAGEEVSEEPEEVPAAREEVPEKTEEIPAVKAEVPEEPEKRVVIPVEEPAAPEETENFGEFEITCVIVEAESGPKRIPFAVEKLKKTHEVLGNHATQVAKISGVKLNAKGVHHTFKHLAGRDLIVDDAADLSHEAAAELVEEMKRPRESMVLLLVDTTVRMDEFLISNPELDQRCVYLDEGEQMDADEFAACANAYAKEEECVIDEMAVLAIHVVAERLRDDGKELTEEMAKKLVDDAIDRAEHRGIKGLFGSKYNKEGYLILKEQFFKSV